MRFYLHLSGVTNGKKESRHGGVQFQVVRLWGIPRMLPSSPTPLWKTQQTTVPVATGHMTYWNVKDPNNLYKLSGLSYD